MREGAPVPAAFDFAVINTFNNAPSSAGGAAAAAADNDDDDDDDDEVGGGSDFRCSDGRLDAGKIQMPPSRQPEAPPPYSPYWQDKLGRLVGDSCSLGR